MPKVKEKGTRTPELNEIIEAFEQYRKQLYDSSTVSPTKFQHAQTALHNAKNIVRKLYGVKPKGDTAWVK